MMKFMLLLTVVLVVRGAWGKTVTHPGCPFIGHYLLPHEYDCTKFYYCEWGNKHIEPKQCEPGTEFSEELQVCTWPFIANCTLPGHPPSESSTTTKKPIPEPPTTTTEATTTTTTTTTPAPGCPVDPDHPNRNCTKYCNILPWAHEDCDKYWICKGNKAVLVVCSAGLHFNPSTNSCDFACNAGCERKTVQATADHDGLNLYLPWNKIDEHTKELIKLISK